MHQTFFTTPIRIKSSNNNMHIGKSLNYLWTQNKQALWLREHYGGVWLREHYGGFGRSTEERLTQLKGDH